MKEQEIFWGDIAGGLQIRAQEKGISRALLICGRRMCLTDAGRRLQKEAFVSAVYSDFEPNPVYGNVLQALEQFEEKQCDAIIALGGGSAIDIAKCVKAFYGMGREVNFLEQEILPNTIPIIAIPTTAGTGSEATSFAVLYHEGRKYSVEDPSLVPDAVFMDASLLKTLPLYQKKVTALDAFCHCVEAFWSKNGTKESKGYAAEGMQGILENYSLYFAGDSRAAENMLLAANYAGRAINIAKTTAAHAMCYRLTKSYGLPHGHAAALCLAVVWKHTWKLAKQQENRGVLSTLDELAGCLGCETIEASVKMFGNLLEEFGIKFARRCSGEDISALAGSVNAERMGNHPVKFDKGMIVQMYEEITGG